MAIKKYTSVFLKLCAFVFCVASTTSLAQPKQLNPFSEKTFTLLAPEKNRNNMWRVSISKKKPLTLGSADQISVLGFAQLDGAPFSLNIRQPPKAVKALNFSGNKTKKNIVLILKSNSLKEVMGSQLIFEKLFLINIETNKIIWQETINEYSKKNGGYKTVSLDFISPDKTQYKTQAEINRNILFIKAVQTSMPSIDMSAYMPGAPLTFLYALHKNTYKKLSD